MDATTWDGAGAERAAGEATRDPADEGGVEALWDAHHAAVLGYALRRLPAEDAREIAADAFVVAWRRRHQTRAADRAWLIGIARNLVAWDGLDAREASIVVGCSAPTFAVRLHRARRRLRRALAEEDTP